MSEEQYSLVWSSFQSNLAVGFQELLHDEAMVDVTLAAEGKFLQAHKVMLSVCSPYFRDLFKANPCKHPIVILKDVRQQELSDILDFIYRGEVSVRQENLAAFLKLAEMLKVKGLSDHKMTKCDPKKQLKKKRATFDPGLEDDPGDSDYEVRKRKRANTPPKTDSPQVPTTSSSSSELQISEQQERLVIVDPKKESVSGRLQTVEFIEDEGEVGIEEAAAGDFEDGDDPLANYLDGSKMSNRFDESTHSMEFDATGTDGGEDLETGPYQDEGVSDQVTQQDILASLINPCQPQQSEHPIFEHFKREGDRATCLVCMKTLAYKGSSYITSLTNHLARVRGHEKRYSLFLRRVSGASNSELPLDVVEPMVELKVPKEELFIPPEMDLPPSTTISRVRNENTVATPLVRPVRPEQLFPPSQFAQNSTPPRQRNSTDSRPPHDSTNPIWEYFILDDDKALCKICGKRITYRNNAYVTNLVTHLRTRGIGHDACYTRYMMKKGEMSCKMRDEISLNYFLSNIAQFTQNSDFFPGQGGHFPPFGPSCPPSGSFNSQFPPPPMCLPPSGADCAKGPIASPNTLNSELPSEPVFCPPELLESQEQLTINCPTNSMQLQVGESSN